MDILVFHRGDQPPKHENKVLCVTETAKGARNYVLAYYCHHLNEWASGMNRNVILWAELPGINCVSEKV